MKNNPFDQLTAVGDRGANGEVAQRLAVRVTKPEVASGPASATAPLQRLKGRGAWETGRRWMTACPLLATWQVSVGHDFFIFNMIQKMVY